VLLLAFNGFAPATDANSNRATSLLAHFRRDEAN
jgi:hypothetical protein